MLTKRIEISNDADKLKEVSGDLVAALKKEGVAEEIIFDIHVGFEEALRNAMVHGNKEHPEKKVVVETEVTEEEVVLAVEDEGGGFDHECVPDPTEGDNVLKECGRGVFLIKHLMDSVEYTNGGRRVIMRKKIKQVGE